MKRTFIVLLAITVVLIGAIFLVKSTANASPLAPGILSASAITTLYGTGLDTSGNPLAGGAVDPHYSILEAGGANAIVRTGLPSTYFPNDANSQWIWQNSNGGPTNVTRTFRTTFDLGGLDPSKVGINGAWGTDNQGLDILLNNISTGITLLGVTDNNFNKLHAWTITSGFEAGVNTLDFVIRDNGLVAGFRTELTGTVVPIPAALYLFGSSLIVLVAMVRRKKVA